MSRSAFSGWTSRGGGSCDAIPGKHKGNAIALSNRKLGDRLQVFAVGLDRRVKDQPIRPRDRFQTAVAPAHPWDDRSVIEPDNQFHPDRHLPREALDNPNDIGIGSARRHEIDVANRASARVQIGLQNQSVATISAFPLLDFFLRREPPRAVFRSA